MWIFDMSAERRPTYLSTANKVTHQNDVETSIQATLWWCCCKFTSEAQQKASKHWHGVGELQTETKDFRVPRYSHVLRLGGHHP